MRFLKAGDSGLVIEFGNEISERINRLITYVTGKLDQAEPAGSQHEEREIGVLRRGEVSPLPTALRASGAPLSGGAAPATPPPGGLGPPGPPINTGILDIIPTYRSILVNFDPLCISARDIANIAAAAVNDFSASPEAADGEVIEIPVLYGGEKGPDMDFISAHTGLPPEEVIRLHSSVEYLIYMIGFTPGFPYLGGMPKEIATPRLQKPRALIPAGSVGIAAGQTGIYPVESPGGWQLLGRTPVKIFDCGRDPPFLLAAGNYLKFVPVTEDEYAAIEKAEAEGTYRPVRRGKEG